MNKHKGSTRRHGASSTGMRFAALVILVMGTAGCDLYFGRDIDVPGEEPDALPPGGDTCGEDGLPGPTEGGGGAFPLELGPTVKAQEPPPAISGGTLAVTPDDSTVVAADPDRDQVYLVSLDSQSVTATIALEDGDEPGRVVVDDAQRAHVALRSGGAVATIDLTAGTVLARHTVCRAPRGLDFDDVTGHLFVACHGGLLLTMDPGTGDVIDKKPLQAGLRDVVATGSHIYVTEFRTAKAIILDRDLKVVERVRPPGLDTKLLDPELGEIEAHFEPAVAWRTVESPSGAVVMLHQRGRNNKIPIGPGRGGGYAGDFCTGGIVHGAVTPIRAGVTPPVTQSLGFAVLPVDLALVDSGQSAVVVAAGNTAGEFPVGPAVVRVPTNQRHDPFECFFDQEYEAWDGTPTAVAATSDDDVVVQFREPAMLSIFVGDTTVSPTRIPLSDTSRKDTGHTLFHMNTGGGIACASCHPEGGDDARTWDFDCLGLRRTQSLHIGLLGTEPFHWEGDMDSMDKLMTEVFVGRMGGGEPTADQVDAMASWLDTLRPPPRREPDDLAAVERGEQLFEDPRVGCASCHAGTKLTNNQSYDVGTGGVFQVPSLIGVADRAPYIHTGCAATLRDRFTDPQCGGGDSHGVTSHLTSRQIDDLVAYLETL